MSLSECQVVAASKVDETTRVNGGTDELTHKTAINVDGDRK